MLGIINCVKNRPENTKKFSDDYRIKNGGKSSIMFVFDKTDTTLDKQIEAVGDLPYIVSPYDGRGVAIRIQHGYEALRSKHGDDIKLYHSTADDITYSKNFDIEMLSDLEYASSKAGHRLWVMYGDDKVHGQRLSTHWFASKEYVDTIGHFCPSDYMKHCHTDEAFFVTGFNCGILRYVPWVVTHHHSWANGEAPKDKNYEIAYNQKVLEEDNQLWNLWLQELFPINVRKIMQKIPRIEA